MLANWRFFPLVLSACRDGCRLVRILVSKKQRMHAREVLVSCHAEIVGHLAGNGALDLDRIQGVASVLVES